MATRFVNDLILKDECFKIIGICQKIHAELGPGFRESVYKDAMQVHFEKDELPFEREKKFIIQYLGKKLKHTFDADYFVFNSIILEVKCTPTLYYSAFIQTLNYLKAADVKLGIINNFGERSLTFRRVVLTK